ncbi:AI-2E family transporter [Luteolibacter sp. SL250]|uniref:AI-2E family transporter n=1 Tax=Luteolibacter sp. SL250 TaxID=2995170 RepID=UPI002270C480|nr:AI-2E family transporter [Luteolibacter sp. SL250]WAC17992.1 AI-2E family transporter [Luteolibacter sp. SL250]
MEQGARRTGFKIEPLLGGLALLLLLVGCVVVLKPFLSSLMWAIVLSYSLYPLQRRFTIWFRGSRTLAACLVTLTLTVILAGPIVLIGMSLVQDGKDLAGATKKWFLAAPEEAPPWVHRLPIVGDEAAAYWTEFSEDRKRWMEDVEKAAEADSRKKRARQEEEMVDETIPVPLPVEPEDEITVERPDSSRLVVLLGQTLGMARKALVTAGVAVGQGVTQVMISAFLAFFFLRDASLLADRLQVAVERLAGDRGKHLLKVAGDTVRGVIYGFLGTALIQAIVAGTGFWIADVPGAILLGVLTFFFAVVPFGPPIVWVPATLWLFAQGRPGWGIFMMIWGFFGISGVDNVVRPLIISQGSKMPFVLIFCGVIGGALAFGLVGLFLGPTLLAVAYRLIDEWSTNPVLAGPKEGGNYEI